MPLPHRTCSRFPRYRLPRGLISLFGSLLLCLLAQPAWALTIDPSTLNATLTPGGEVSQRFAAVGSGGNPQSIEWELLEGVGQLTPRNDSASADYSYTDPGNLQHCDTRTAQIAATDFSIEFPTPASASIEITYQDPLSISGRAQSLSGAPGATVRFTTTLSGGRAPFAGSALLPGATVTISGNQMTYQYQIPIGTPAGMLSDSVTVNGQSTSCGGDSATIDVGINVTPPLSVSPSELTLSGEPGSQVNAQLQISGGGSPYSASASDGGQVALNGGIIDYSYAIPDGATGSLSDVVRVIDENAAFVDVPISIQVTSSPPPELTVTPAQLALEGAPSSQVTGQLQISGGFLPYTANAEIGQVSVNDSVVDYRYDIPGGAAGRLSDSIRVTDEQGASRSVAVSIEVSSPIVVTPSPLALSGRSAVGIESSASKTFAVAGGTPPYTLVVASGGSGQVEPGRLDSAGNAVYSVVIPANAAAMTISDQVLITDARGLRLELPVTLEVAASNALSSRPDLTPNQRSVARAIETLCPQLSLMTNRTPDQQDLFQQCSDMLANASSSSIPRTLTEITTEKANAATSVAITTGTQQMTNIGERLAALRRGATGVSVRGLSLNLDGQSLSADRIADALSAQRMGGAASGDDAFGRWGFFINGSFNFGDKDATDNESGFDFSTAGVSAGVDYRFSDEFIAGGALGYGNNDTSFDANGGGLDTETWHLGAYGTYSWSDRGYVDAMLEYGWQSYDSSRNIRYRVDSSTQAVSRQARADYDGTQFGISVGAGYDFDEGPLSYGLYGRAGYLEVNVDGFTERGAGGLDLQLDDFDATSVTTTLGARIARVFNTKTAVLVPQGRIEWEHEYDQDGTSLAARFAAAPSAATFGILTDNPDRDYFRIGLGLSAVFPHGVSVFVNYDALLDKRDWTDNLIDVGLRWEFE